MATLANSVRSAEASLTAENTFTDWMVLSGSPWSAWATGTFSATVTVQAVPPNGYSGTAADIIDLDELTAPGVLNGTALCGASVGWLVRVGIKTGDFTSGTAKVGVCKVGD